MLKQLPYFIGRSLTLKIYLYSLLAFTLLTLLISWSVDLLVHENLTTAASQNREDRIAFIAREVIRLDPDAPGAPARLAELEKGLGIRLRYIPWKMSADYPASLKQQPLVRVERTWQGRTPTHYWVRIEQQGHPVGALYIRFGPSMPSFPVIYWLRIVTPMAVLALILIPPLLYWVIRPLASLEKAAERLGEGDLDTPVVLHRSDELGRLAGAIEYMRQQIKRTLHEKERLLIDVSHELRGPLSRMSLAQTMLEEDYGINAYVSQLRHEMERMDMLIGELLALARGHVPTALQSESLDLSQLTTELLQERQMLIQQGSYVLQSQLQAAPLQGDPVLLRRALSNILDNALKYTPPGGHLQVSTGRANGEVYYRVADNGPGIPAQAQPHIFEPFYRPDTARSRQTGGTGLGLAIVKAVVERHGGRVTVDSKEGHGTLAEVRLPS